MIPSRLSLSSSIPLSLFPRGINVGCIVMSRTFIHIHIQMIHLRDGQPKKVTTKVQGFRESEACISFKEKVMAMWGGPFPWPHGDGSQAAMHGAQSSVKRLLFKALCWERKYQSWCHPQTKLSELLGVPKRSMTEISTSPSLLFSFKWTSGKVKLFRER